MRSLLFIKIIMVAFCSLTYAQLSGPLSGTLGPGTFTVIGDISVEQNDSLVILPGTELLFYEDCEFFVRGSLYAVGELDDSIRFAPILPNTHWEGIEFPQLADNCELGYCIISGSVDRGLNISDLTISIRNCAISGNSYFSGGGIFCSSSELLLENCVVCNNTASDGGGIYITNESKVTINNCEFLNNSADQEGGGVYCEEFDSLNIINSSFIENSSCDYGGGLFITEGRSLYVESSFINDNITLQEAGGGLRIYGVDQTYIVNCLIANNIAEEYGGGLAISWSETLLRSCTIDNNIAGSSGGGLFFAGLDFFGIDMFQCTISNNSAESGGGIKINNPYESILEYCQIYGNYAEEWGGGIDADLFFMDLIIKHCTITDNQAGILGGGIYGVCYPYYSSDLIVHNSILWNNVISQIEGNRHRILYSDIQGGIAGLGNINLNPLFVDPLNYDYSLSGQSPCIDAGDPNSPFDPDSTITDMGALYYDQTPQGFEDLTIMISGFDVVLDWNDIPDATVYHIYRSDVPYFDISTLTAIANPVSSDFFDYDAVGEDNYFYCVTYEISINDK